MTKKVRRVTSDEEDQVHELISLENHKSEYEETTMIRKFCQTHQFSDSVPISRIMLRCIYGYQKWIPYKILHRNDNPKKFSTFIFSLKKLISKM